MEQYKIGDLLIGKVVNVRPYAIFLSFEENTSGLLHISEISDSFIRDIEKFASVGDQIKVKIISIDSNNGFLRVSLKRVPEDERFSTHSNKERKPITVNKEEFMPLEEKLGEWISETLEKSRKGK